MVRWVVFHKGGGVVKPWHKSGDVVKLRRGGGDVGDSQVDGVEVALVLVLQRRALSMEQYSG